MNKIIQQINYNLQITNSMRYVVFLLLGWFAFSVSAGLFFVFIDLEHQVSMSVTITDFFKVAILTLLISFIGSIGSIVIALKYRS